jgi:hypothetical protein
MKCREATALISAQLDGVAGASGRAALAAHLSNCAACRQASAELRRQRDELRLIGLARSSDAAEAARAAAMAQDTLVALQIEARRQRQLVRRKADRVDAVRTWLFSQSVGMAVSLVLLFLLVTAILKPAHRAFAILKTAGDTLAQADDSEEIAKLRDVLLPAEPGPKPVFDPRGALLGFSRDMDEEGEFIVVAWVGSDGRAAVKKVIEQPHNPAIIRELHNALYQQASFKPAYRRGRFITSDAVLMFSKVTISG